MADVFHLPAVGDTMVEAEIVEWLVDVGDEVSLDQAICSIETDKSVVEMTTPYRGFVLALGGEPGDVLAVGEPLIAVGASGEPAPNMAALVKAPRAEAAAGTPPAEASPARAPSPDTVATAIASVAGSQTKSTEQVSLEAPSGDSGSRGSS